MKDAVLCLRDLGDEEDLHLELRASNGRVCVAQDFIAGLLEDLEAFGRGLCSFPGSPASEVCFEAGSPEPGWAYLVRLRAYPLDPAGHSALEVEAIDHADEPRGHSARFHIRCEPAALNRLGAQLVSWCRGGRERPLAWHPLEGDGL